MDPHLLLTVTTLTDSVLRDYLREDGLDRVDTMDYLQALLRSLSLVCASHTLIHLFMLCLPCLTVFMFQANYAARNGIAVTESSGRD